MGGSDSKYYCNRHHEHATEEEARRCDKLEYVRIVADKGGARPCGKGSEEFHVHCDNHAAKMCDFGSFLKKNPGLSDYHTVRKLAPTFLEQDETANQRSDLMIAYK